MVTPEELRTYFEELQENGLDYKEVQRRGMTIDEANRREEMISGVIYLLDGNETLRETVGLKMVELEKEREEIDKLITENQQLQERINTLIDFMGGRA